MIFETSWDDGVESDFRMADLLEKYQLPGIFFIPTITELKEEDIKRLSQRFDIGGHSTSHHTI